MGSITQSIDYKLASMMKDPSGFVAPGTITMSYDDTTQKITMYSSTGVIEIAENRRLYSIPATNLAPFITTAHTNATGSYWMTFTGGNFVWAGTVWTFDKVQVAKVIYNTTQTPAGFFVKECHDLMQWQTHQELHEKIGATLSAPVVLADYAITTGAGITDADLTYSIPQGVLDDEDLHHTLSALADGGPYTILQRSGVAGTWTWLTTHTVPFLRTAPSLLMRRNYDAGGGTGWTTAPATGTSNRLNMWVCAVPNGTAGLFRYIIIPGQTFPTSSGTALSETFAQMSLGTLLTDLAEIFVFAQVTLKCDSTAGNGRTAIETVTTIIGSAKTTIAAAVSPSNHQTLSNRNTLTQHQLLALEATSAGKVIVSQADGAGGFNLTESATTEAELAIIHANVAKKYALVGFDELGALRYDGANAQILAYGDTANRPGGTARPAETATIGMIRFNTQLNMHETYRTCGWVCVGHQWASGVLTGGADVVFTPPTVATAGVACQGYSLLVNLNRSGTVNGEKIQIEAEIDNITWRASIISLAGTDLGATITIADATGIVTVTGITGTYKTRADGFIY
jgi:hypothetical protein